VKTAAFIFATIAAFATFGDGPVVHVPKGWADVSEFAPPSGERRATATVVPPSLQSLSSRDNFVEVFSDEIDPADGIGFKGPVFKSAVDAVERLSSVSGLEMPRGGAGLVIHVGKGTNEDASVVCRVERNSSRRVVTRLYLPSPAFSDLDLFDRQIAAAYLRAWASRTAEAAAGSGAAPFKEPPEWVAHGLSRAANETFALFDRLDAVAFWQGGEMPFFKDVQAELDPATDRGSSLCGFMVKWMLEHKLKNTAEKGAVASKPKGKTPTAFTEMMGRLAKNEEWSQSAMNELLTGETDPHKQDEAFDVHMWKLMHAVLVPGQSTPEDVKTFASRLLLYPPFFDISFRDGRKACPFRLAIRNATDPVVRISAYMKQRTLELTVIGRGEKLVKAAESHVRFLRALARGEDKDALTEKLDEAEALLGAAYTEAVERFGT